MSKDDKENEEVDFSNATQGAIVTAKGVKLPVSIRLDGDVIDYFKKKAEQQGGKAKYQTLINEALREYIHGASIERLLLSEQFIEAFSKGLKKYSA